MKLKTSREIQLVLIQDYKIVSQIWKNHNYYFCFTGGSIIGALRHKGFIPWDDDLDVGLSREDYNDFIENTSKEMPDYLKLYLRKKTQQYVILDTRYELDYAKEEIDSLFDGESDVAYPTLDIQIFDGTPNNKILRIIHCLRVMALRAKIKMSDSQKIHAMKWRPWWENALIRIIKILPKKKRNVDADIEKFTKLISKYKFSESDYIADFIGKYHFKDIYPKKWWTPVQWVDFEDEKVPIPNGYHYYLSRIYGDYMKVPDVEDREQHAQTD